MSSESNGSGSAPPSVLLSRLCRACTLALLWSCNTAAWADTLPWVLIDTRAETLTVMGHSGPRAVFSNIALGVRGVGIKRRRGDEITPTGSFRLGWINHSSRFELFFGLDYPNYEHAGLALHDGRINQRTYQSIVKALDSGRSPPQNTVLGGQIGIHGVGAGDPRVHENTDWTNGCVALTNSQIRGLAEWVQVGTRVEIR